MSSDRWSGVRAALGELAEQQFEQAETRERKTEELKRLVLSRASDARRAVERRTSPQFDFREELKAQLREQFPTLSDEDLEAWLQLAAM